MLWHTGEKIFNELVRDQGVPEIKFGDVRLGHVLASETGYRSVDKE